MITSYEYNLSRNIYIRNYQQINFALAWHRPSNLHKFRELVLSESEVQPAGTVFVHIFDCCLVIEEYAFVVTVQGQSAPPIFYGVLSPALIQGLFPDESDPTECRWLTLLRLQIFPLIQAVTTRPVFALGRHD